jgi:hypothetical protein
MQMWSAAAEMISRHADVKAVDGQGHTPLEYLSRACTQHERNAGKSGAHPRHASAAGAGAASESNGSQALPGAASGELPADVDATVQAIRSSKLYLNTPEGRRTKMDAFLNACTSMG